MTLRRDHISTYVCTALLAVSACLFAIACGGSSSSNATQPPGIPTLYGNGSAGPLTIAVSTTLTDANTQYTNVIVNAGQTLTVQSGTVIHCTGTFTVNGTLNVATGGNGGNLENDTDFTATTLSPQIRPGTQGLADSAAGFPEVGGTTDICLGGEGGIGQGTESRFIFYPGHNAGGSGAGAPGNTGGAGGGGLTVLAFGAISIPGTLNANGGSPVGAGGGAGGVVVLASTTSITVAGTVNCNGGDGGGSQVDSGASAGGGGGIINLFAPSITGVNGTDLVVTAGAAGSTATNATSTFRSGGAGGGGCGGNGGQGGTVSAADVSSAASAASAGQINKVTADPTGLFP
jgi:hypothetical protein